VIEGVESAHGMAYQNELVEAEMIDESFNITAVSVATVVGVLGPRAFAMAALVEGVAVMLSTQHEADYIPGVGIQRGTVKEDHGRPTLSAPVQIVQTHSLPRHHLAFGKNDLHVNARNSGCERQVFQFVCWRHGGFLFLSAFHALVLQTRVGKGLRSRNWRW